MSVIYYLVEVSIGVAIAAQSAVNNQLKSILGGSVLCSRFSSGTSIPRCCLTGTGGLFRFRYHLTCPPLGRCGDTLAVYFREGQHGPDYGQVWSTGTVRQSERFTETRRYNAGDGGRILC